jgi:uncharacterized protein (TIGR02453 family)
MKSIGIPKTTIQFLKDLEKNNTREWFNANKERFLREEDKMREFAEALHAEMRKYDLIDPMSGKQILFRIYRDTRFSKDKTPYKNNRSGGFKRSTARLRGGYYFHIQPGNQSFLGGGFWAPNKEDLKRIREEIAFDDKPLRKILSGKRFKDTFGTLQGDQVITAPKGFPRDHPAIDLLRYKQFIVTRKFTDKEVLSDTFLNEANQTFKAMRPFFDYMSEVLTTDSNGRSLID